MAEFLRERAGWEGHLRPFLHKELPSGTGWTATLGTLCALLFGTMALSGMALAMSYSPSPDKAYRSIDYIMGEPAGALLRGVHHWGSGALVLAVVVHLFATFFSGAFRRPREITWTIGVCLLFVVLGLGFTGYLLPWDMKAYWATVVSGNIARDVPFIGNVLTRTLLGGPTVSGMTLTRFYAMHTLVLPALLAVLAGAHIVLVRIHGLAEPGVGAPDASAGDRPYRFYPEHVARSALVFACVFVVIVGLALLRHPPREPIAGTLTDSYLPRPEWYFMWLFQLLTYFPGRWELIGSVAIPVLGVVALFAVPALGARQRGVAIAAGVMAVVGILYLSVTGFEDARTYGRIVPVPDRRLTASEARGLSLFVDRDCAYCHQIAGKGGHRTGPDLVNIAAKGRTRERLARYIKNPRLASATSLMPAYDLPDSDLRALADFVLALGIADRPLRTISRDDALKRSATLAE